MSDVYKRNNPFDSEYIPMTHPSKPKHLIN